MRTARSKDGSTWASTSIRHFSDDHPEMSSLGASTMPQAFALRKHACLAGMRKPKARPWCYARAESEMQSRWLHSNTSTRFLKCGAQRVPGISIVSPQTTNWIAMFARENAVEQNMKQCKICPAFLKLPAMQLEKLGRENLPRNEDPSCPPEVSNGKPDSLTAPGPAGQSTQFFS